MLKWKKNPAINAYGEITNVTEKKSASITGKNQKVRAIATYSDQIIRIIMFDNVILL